MSGRMIFVFIATCGLCYFLGIYTERHLHYMDYADGFVAGFKMCEKELKKYMKYVDDNLKEIETMLGIVDDLK